MAATPPSKPTAHDGDSDYETPREHLPHAYADAQAAPSTSVAGAGGGSLFHAQDLVGVRKGPNIPAAAPAPAPAGVSQRPGSSDVKGVSRRPAKTGSISGAASFIRR